MNAFYVSGENSFTVPSTVFGIAATTSGYELQWSVDRTTWTKLADVAASTNKAVTDSCRGWWYRLKNNTDTGNIKIVYE